VSGEGEKGRLLFQKKRSSLLFVITQVGAGTKKKKKNHGFSGKKKRDAKVCYSGHGRLRGKKKGIVQSSSAMLGGKKGLSIWGVLLLGEKGEVVAAIMVTE